MPEYAREYLLKYGTQYSYEDLLIIAKGQLNSEEVISQSAIRNSRSEIFIDTDMYVMKVWCEFVFGKCHQYIINEITTRKYDLYLLCNIDLPWTKDELREYPDLKTREKLFYIYKDLLVNQATPWAIISGNNEERLTNAIRVIQSSL